MLDKLLNIFLMLLLPPLLPGVIGRTKAWFAGRRGAPFLQPYFDLARLFRKGLVISRTTGWIFAAGPVVTLSSLLAGGLLVPAGPLQAPISFAGDLILFAYLLGLARFFTTTAALDTGSAFEGMGATRELAFASLSEPALFFGLLVLAKISGSLSLEGMLMNPWKTAAISNTAPLILVTMGLFIVLLAESCRIPVDDPTTHLELTMIHEVMVLDHSGPLLGIALYASAVKLYLLEAVLLHLLAPFRTGILLADTAIFAVQTLAFAVFIGILESMMARLRMKRVPYLLTGALILCCSAFILLVR